MSILLGFLVVIAASAIALYLNERLPLRDFETDSN
jgi:hypothetical protein